MDNKTQEELDAVLDALKQYVGIAVGKLVPRMDKQYAQIEALEKALAERDRQLDRHREHLTRIESRLQLVERK